MPSTVTVHYPFHPLHGRELPVIKWSQPSGQGVTVQHPDGKSLKIPSWMLDPGASRYHLADEVELAASALKALADLLPSVGLTMTQQPEPSHAADHSRTRRRQGAAPALNPEQQRALITTIAEAMIAALENQPGADHEPE